MRVTTDNLESCRVFVGLRARMPAVRRRGGVLGCFSSRVFIVGFYEKKRDVLEVRDASMHATMRIAVFKVEEPSAKKWLL